MPDCLQTEIFLYLQFDGFQKAAVQMVKPAKGTTTLAFIFKEGIIVAADSRASMGGYICMNSIQPLLIFISSLYESSLMHNAL